MKKIGLIISLLCLLGFATRIYSAGKSVWGWGCNDHGQLGDGTTTNRVTPVQAGSLTDCIAVAAGGAGSVYTDHSLAIKDNGSGIAGTVYAWGANYWGQLGYGDTLEHRTPVQVISTSMGTDIKAIAIGVRHSLALKSDSTVWAWGNDSYGELGIGSSDDNPHPAPAKVSNLSGIIAIAAGFDFSIALKSDGTLWAWGQNECGELGRGSVDYNTTNNIPTEVKKDASNYLTGVIAIAAGAGGSNTYGHAHAVKSDGTVWGWGSAGAGELGDGTIGDVNYERLYPVQVKTGSSTYLTNCIAVAAGYQYAFALKNDNTVWAWGYNNYGQLGDNSTSQSLYAVQAKVDATNYLTGITAIAACVGTVYYPFSLALKSDETLWGWGDNSYGQLGFGYGGGSKTVANLATVVDSVSAIAAGMDFTLVLASEVAGGINEQSNIENKNTKLEVYPNPFTEKTVIRFNVGNRHICSLQIYDLSGKLVKKLISDHLPLPTAVTWDGKNNDGKKVSAGIYFVEFKAGNYTELKKLILVR